MKANAPEKIYIPITEGQEIAINEWGSIPLSQYEHKRVVENIEYTRTDAFIEKVEEFLYEKLNNGDMECGDIHKFIENFKNYMEGKDDGIQTKFMGSYTTTTETDNRKKYKDYRKDK